MHIKGKYPDIDTVHFVTASQYKQKKNFSMFVNRLYTYGFIKSTWNFLAAGHGKGPADGIGAVVKRTADRLVARGIEEEDKYIPSDLRVVPGTMKIHQMSTNETETLSYRVLSCFCAYPDEYVCHSPVTEKVQYQEPNFNVQALYSTSGDKNTR